ncbi:Rhodanese-like domain-containing protein [Prosthecobacter debontii]|uniref:Rhodanese-like domain-containing protein n=1 Tax=Prosthecobacter debontii TaxID=48467 RepID=A0A1T4Z1L6_9BACT|nr:YceI family protein [Prosthecobacter debontii]SKB07773.1 Rhodanese-like domain-containing protein [Prosthecobacter debontii]
MQVTLLSPQELDSLRLLERDLVILDVRLHEDHERRRIQGSVSNCVYEVAFQERLPALIATKATPVCVYGESASSHEAEAAAEKLKRAGYTRVYRLAGCLAGWCEAGLPEEGTGEFLPPSPPPEGRLEINTEESRVEWLGRNLLNKHWGKVPIQSGWLEITGGLISSGEIVLDMNGITCDDLATSPYHDVLIAHLRSDDFFDTEQYPEARLVIHRGEPIEGTSPGSQNLKVEGALTLRGITAPVEFTASSGFDDRGRTAAQAAFAIDRTRWGVLYGSGSFFHRLAGHLVNDLIELQVRVITHTP